MMDDDWFMLKFIPVCMAVISALMVVVIGLSGAHPFFSTTSEGTVTQVSTSWVFTTINFASNSFSVGCWSSEVPPLHAGEQIIVYQPAWEFWQCKITVVNSTS